jgi:hypothetical protein
MPHPRFSGDEIARHGQELYEQRINGFKPEAEFNDGGPVTIKHP